MLTQTLKAVLRLCVRVQGCVCVFLSLSLCMCVCKCVCRCVCVCVCACVCDILFSMLTQTLQAGLGLVRTKVYFQSGFQFTKRLIVFVCVETNQIIGSNPNVILTRQTCGQRSNMAAESKRRALALYFSMRICYRFIMSKCSRGD